LQSFADEPAPEKREALRELVGAFADHLTPERARELAAHARSRERRLNDAFVASVVSELRKLVRKASKRGASVLILIEPVDPETLRGTELQGTLTRLRAAQEHGDVRGRVVRNRQGFGQVLPALRPRRQGNEAHQTLEGLQMPLLRTSMG
jgi:hypothetical protein